MLTKKILITGALGHIGSRLIRDISRNAADHLVLIDNLLTQRYVSLFDLPTDRRFEFFVEDIMTMDIEKRTTGAGAVIHLAGMTDADKSHGREKEFEAVNLEGLKRVANACLKTNVPLLFPSTTSVYGSQAAVVDETCKELRPQSPYAATKLLAEQYLASLKPKGLRYVICRFGTIFGWSIGMRFHTAVNTFIWQAVSGVPLTVWKTAWRQRRPYLDLDDCVRAVDFILKNDLFDGETYNVLTKNFTVEDVVTTIQKFVPDLRINFVDSRIMNQLSYDVDDTKLRKLGLTPRGDLEKGIRETIKKFRGMSNAHYSL